jgi:hypothetical protein
VLAVTEIDGLDQSGGTSRESDKLSQLEGRTRAYGDRARIYLECTVSHDQGAFSGSITKMPVRNPAVVGDSGEFQFQRYRVDTATDNTGGYPIQYYIRYKLWYAVKYFTAEEDAYQYTGPATWLVDQTDEMSETLRIANPKKPIGDPEVRNVTGDRWRSQILCAITVDGNDGWTPVPEST